MILDGVMVILATMCLTFLHPGMAFGHRWNDTKFAFFGPEVSLGYTERTRRITEKREETEAKKARLEERRAEFARHRTEMRVQNRYISGNATSNETSNEKTEPTVSESSARSGHVA